MTWFTRATLFVNGRYRNHKFIRNLIWRNWRDMSRVFFFVAHSIHLHISSFYHRRFAAYSIYSHKPSIQMELYQIVFVSSKDDECQYSSKVDASSRINDFSTTAIWCFLLTIKQPSQFRAKWMEIELNMFSVKLVFVLFFTNIEVNVGFECQFKHIVHICHIQKESGQRKSRINRNFERKMIRQFSSSAFLFSLTLSPSLSLSRVRFLSYGLAYMKIHFSFHIYCTHGLCP